MLGHRLVATSLLYTGDFEEGRTHLDRAIALYDPVEHRPLATRFGQDAAVSILCYRSWVLWFLGYPEAALTDTEHALRDAREIGHAATLMYALVHASLAHSYCGIYAAANAEAAEDVALANEIGSLFWAAFGTTAQGFVSALTGKVSDAVQTIASGLAALRPTGTRMWLPLYLSSLAGAYAELGQFDDAWRCIEEARTTMETTKERWWEAEAHRTAGEIALKSQKPDAVKAQAYFDRALAVTRAQRAKSLELRAAMSMARLWRDQGKRDEARELLAPVYGWFTEGFDTVDLKEAKDLLNDLGA